MLSGDSIGPVEYGGKLPLELVWRAQVPDIIAADTDDDEVIACAADRLEHWQQVSYASSVAGSVMYRNLRDVMGEFAGESIFRSVSTGADRGAIAEYEYFFERVSVLHRKGSRPIGQRAVHAEMPEHFEC